MVAVLDGYARHEAQSLIEQHGDLATARVRERAGEAARRGDLVMVGICQIIAFEIEAYRAIERAAAGPVEPGAESAG
jgi:hypothetical protein